MSNDKRYTVQPQAGHVLVHNPGGPTLGMAQIHIKEQGGLDFPPRSGPQTCPSGCPLRKLPD